MIAIIDYGIGNVFNVQNAVVPLMNDAKLTSSPAEILSASHIILPGVGAFRDAIEALEQQGLVEVLKQAHEKRIPILGICLGMQLLYEVSYENGTYQGLGFLKGPVVRFPEPQVKRIPQIGWNTLVENKASLFSGVEGEVYFVHSYYAQGIEDEILTYVDYDGVKVPAIVGSDKVYGMQFHPEKSAEVGRKLLERFFSL
ncbi:imidazole glycerol phosphate synthase subunit HisH [Fusibacter paucivorans]|uniref:Imidazole glycerol phosphate synthase subunit HisH n=1 Tax=Fusibacter paucivorans TaxID=76009 RepID=A0ABS5PLP5_9FIRM|nr:imidazole glycerol phosphate synthase subunit HisH [Fusibacter paucivorans]MBS7526089.1 imidazole glycerol phosphate synthase subunit HisH [Fusibacter paucivorans]